MTEKIDLSSACRQLKNPNIKTRKHALKTTKEHERNERKRIA